MRVPRLSMPAVSRSTLVNSGLAVLAVAGSVWAYFLVTANPNAVAFYVKAGFVDDGVVTTRFGPGLRMHADV